MSDETCILLFVKTPTRGKVKSRLAAELGEEDTLHLYENFILDMLDTLKRAEHRLKICFFPPDSEKQLTDWLGKGYAYLPQRGSDLGEKMKNAFLAAFAEGFSRVLIIGSDIPDIPYALLNEALASDTADAVIGPSSDGGYYLIGFTRHSFFPDIFSGIAWGTATVFEKTMEIFAERRHSVHLLPQWQDVDRLRDLRELFARNKDSQFAESRTMAFLRKKQEKLFQYPGRCFTTDQ